MCYNLVNPQKGDIISFGGYDWRVLDVENDKALLLSETVLMNRAYHSRRANITWAGCDLRSYLNGEFYNKFNSQDRARITERRITTNNNPWWSNIKGDDDTTDRIFLLSIEEVVKNFGDSGDLKNKRKKNCNGELASDYDGYCVCDQYNNARIAKNSSGTASWWWLRSPGSYSDDAACVDDDGTVLVSGDAVDYVHGGVRPALWLNL